MKLGYFAVPHLGGTFSVYLSLRAGLLKHGIDLVWVSTGARAVAALQDPDWAHVRHHGIVVSNNDGDERSLVEQLFIRLQDSNLDGVIINVLAEPLETNIARYLPARFLKLMIVHSISIGTYRAARAINDYVHGIVGVSPRVVGDLVTSYGFSAAHTACIPNSLDPRLFSRPPQGDRLTETPLRLLYLGRISDVDKGVLTLPRILELIPPHVATLTIAGDGPDMDRLASQCARFDGQIRLVGRIAQKDVPGLLHQHDVLVFPSKFEGLPMALVEGMAAGCVPIATRLRGVTDFVVEHGDTGYLFPIGHPREAARYVLELAENRALLARMSGAAVQSAESRFSLDLMSERYATFIHGLAARPREIRTPLPITRWRYPLGLKPGLRSRLPEPIKNVLRMWREKGLTLK